jgi:four helix bundle protein
LTPEEMKTRTKAFALRVIRLNDALPRGGAPQVLGKQLLRAGTSVGANYRAACRARSTADFVARMGVVEEEADESAYWLELLCETKLISRNRLAALIEEAYELVAIAAASANTARRSGGLRRR